MNRKLTYRFSYLYPKSGNIHGSTAMAQEMLPFRPKFTSYDPKIWEELWNESEAALMIGFSDARIV
jgi:hypothetical protein